MFANSKLFSLFFLACQVLNFFYNILALYSICNMSHDQLLNLIYTENVIIHIIISPRKYI